MMNFDWIDINTLRVWAVTSGLQTLIIVVVAMVARRAGKFLSRRVLANALGDKHGEDVEREQRAQTLSSVMDSIMGVLIWGVAFMLVLQNLGVSLGPLLAGVGIIGLAASFGAQSLVKDFVSGFFMLMENQFSVGDVVKINNGVSGVVEKVTMRITSLRDMSGTMHVIPNGQINMVSNMTHGWSRAVLDIGVAYKEDIDKVVDVLKKVGERMHADEKWTDLLLEEPQVLGVDSFADSAVVIRMIAKTAPIHQWAVQRELRRRIKIAFDENEIEIPFPHMVMVPPVGPSSQGRKPMLQPREDE
jgi:small-conductance mechanosensitive channel